MSGLTPIMSAPKKPAIIQTSPKPQTLTTNQMASLSKNKNELRAKMQTSVAQAVIDHKRVLVNWATGAGKSRVAINAIKALLDLGKTRILLLVIETAHKDNWKKEFTNALGVFTGTAMYEALKVECYASLSKLENTEWDLIVADEAHHLRSDNRCNILCTLKSERVLCLSATISENKDGQRLLETLEDTFGAFCQFDFSLQEAFNHGVLAEPEIYVHILNFSDIKKPMEFVYERGFKNARFDVYIDAPEKVEKILLDTTRYPNITAYVKLPMELAYKAIEDLRCKQKSLYNQYAASLNDLNRQPTEKELQKKEFMYNGFISVGLLRKKILAKAKTDYARVLIEKLKEKKFICFCNDVEQGKELGGDNFIHSKRNVKQNKAIIDAFNNNESSSLFAVGMLQEGANLTGIEAGLIIQLDGKERPFVQKFGRALRSEAPEQHIIVFRNSQDRQYFKSAMKNMNMNYVHYIEAGERKV